MNVRKKDVTDFIAWVRSTCIVEGGSALADVQNKKRRHLIELFGQATAECVAIAMKTRAVLWTDDYAVAEIARNELGVRRVWTQTIAEQMCEANKLAYESLRDLSIWLVSLGYAFTRVTPHVVIEAARQSGWDAHRLPFAAVARWFGTSGVKPEGVVGILAGSLPALWQDPPMANQREDLTKAIALNVARREDGTELLIALIKVLPRLFWPGRC